MLKWWGETGEEGWQPFRSAGGEGEGSMGKAGQSLTGKMERSPGMLGQGGRTGEIGTGDRDEAPGQSPGGSREWQR